MQTGFGMDEMINTTDTNRPRCPHGVRALLWSLAILGLWGCGGEPNTEPSAGDNNTRSSLDRVAPVDSAPEDIEAELREKLGANQKALFKQKDGQIYAAGLVDSGVKDLAPLQGLKLEILQISRLPIADLSPLEGMPLEFLEAAVTNVKDLSPLEGMPLKFLDLKHTRVEDLSPLKGMPLRELYLEETRMTDLSPLRGMPLQKLYLSKTPVRDLSPLARMNLQELNLVDTKVESIEGLKTAGLGTLWLNETEVKSLAPLRGKRMVSLDVTDTPISDLSPLKDVPSLKRLNIIGTKVADLTPLAGLSLERLLFTPQNITAGNRSRPQHAIAAGTRYDLPRAETNDPGRILASIRPGRVPLQAVEPLTHTDSR